jgi:hypothetical protein
MAFDVTVAGAREFRVVWFETTNTTDQPSLFAPYHQKEALQLKKNAGNNQEEHRKMTRCFLPFVSARHSSPKPWTGTAPADKQVHRPNHHNIRSIIFDYCRAVHRVPRWKNDADATGRVVAMKG